MESMEIWVVGRGTEVRVTIRVEVLLTEHVREAIPVTGLQETLTKDIEGSIVNWK